MSFILSFVSPLEFLLRYTVVVGIIVAISGCAILMMAKKITLAKRKTNQIEKQDRLYQTLFFAGLGFILLGMIFIALPIDATFYAV